MSNSDISNPSSGEAEVHSPTRAEHLAWCKQRALEFVNAGDLPRAMASMVSDLGKHPDTIIDPIVLEMFMVEVMSGNARQVRHFIEGFN